MPTTKVVLLLPLKEPSLLPEYIDKWVKNGVELVWAYGEGAEEFHDDIDNTMIEMGIALNEMPITNATQPTNEDEALGLEQIVAEATSWLSDQAGETEVVCF